MAVAKVGHPAEFVGLMIFSPGFGFASLTGATVSLVRHPHAAEHRVGVSSSHICTHESQKPKFGRLGSRCHSGKWILVVGLFQNFKGDLICCILSFCSLQDQTSQHRFPGRSL